MQGTKYAYLIFNLRPPFTSLLETFQFDPKTELRYGSVKDQLQGPNSSHWPGWIGSIAWDAICSRRKLVLVAWLRSDTVGISDGENIALQDKVCSLFRILPLAAPFTPPTDEVFVITGTGVEYDGRVIADGIQTFSRVINWTQSYYSDHHWKEFLQWAQPGFQNPGILKMWQRCHQLFDSLLIKNAVNRQLMEAFRSFEESTKTKQLEFKIPHLVRALESLIDCWGHKQFSERVLYLIGTPDTTHPYGVATNTGQLLEDLYQLRNDCSHGKPFAYSIEKKGTKFTGELAAKYEYLAEWAARKAINDGFVNPTILANTGDRDQLVAAWKEGLIKPL